MIGVGDTVQFEAGDGETWTGDVLALSDTGRARVRCGASIWSVPIAGMRMTRSNTMSLQQVTVTVQLDCERERFLVRCYDIEGFEPFDASDAVDYLHLLDAIEWALRDVPAEAVAISILPDVGTLGDQARIAAGGAPGRLDDVPLVEDTDDFGAGSS